MEGFFPLYFFSFLLPFGSFTVDYVVYFGAHRTRHSKESRNGERFIEGGSEGGKEEGEKSFVNKTLEGFNPQLAFDGD